MAALTQDRLGDGFADTLAGADDATEAAWVPVKDISALAFDHMEMLQMALERL